MQGSSPIELGAHARIRTGDLFLTENTLCRRRQRVPRFDLNSTVSYPDSCLKHSFLTASDVLLNLPRSWPQLTSDPNRHAREGDGQDVLGLAPLLETARNPALQCEGLARAWPGNYLERRSLRSSDVVGGAS